MKSSLCAYRSNSDQFEAPGIAKPVKEAENRVLRLEQLLCLRRLYRNIVRAEAYHRTIAHVYTPLTEAESSEFTTDEDRQEEREARRSDALDILADMVVIREQIQVRSWPAGSSQADSLAICQLALSPVCPGSWCQLAVHTVSRTA